MSRLKTWQSSSSSFSSVRIKYNVKYRNHPKGWFFSAQKQVKKIVQRYKKLRERDKNEYTGCWDVRHTGKEYNYYFYKGEDGKNYYSTSIGGQPKPTPNNMSHEEMVERLKQNTGNVKSISKAEKAKAEKAHKAERA